MAPTESPESEESRDSHLQPSSARPTVRVGLLGCGNVGAALARLELNVMFSELLARLPDIELATDEALPNASNG